jgi:DNA-binding CsgD family transcriptional regulator
VSCAPPDAQAPARSGKPLATVGGGALGLALSANLTVLGWTCIPYRPTVRDEPLAGAVLLAGWQDHPRDLVAEFAAAGVPVVIIGSLREPRPLIAAVDAGAATVVDPDLPFTELLDTVVAALRTGAVRRRELLCALRSRRRDEELLARLTRRELDVLAALARGCTAARIASDEHLSLATVRSHIRSVMHKLEVSSQLTAVAIARRGDRSLDLTDVRVHQ